MAYLQIDYPSAALRMTTGIRVTLPDEGELSKVNVIYLLHGLTDNCSGWSRYTSCERYARERTAALVMPEVQRGFYMDGVYGPDYFTYVSQELPQAMHRMFGLSLKKEQNYIMGLSMGGYGALKCALCFPRNYAGAAAFSAVCDPQQFFDDMGREAMAGEVPALVGTDGRVKEKDDLFCLLKKSENLPPIYMSCGEQDSLYPMNRKFQQALDEKKTVHHFDHRDGDHTWDFWDRSLQDAFSYFFDLK